MDKLERIQMKATEIIWKDDLLGKDEGPISLD